MALTQYTRLNPENERALAAALQSLPRRKRFILGGLVVIFLLAVVGLFWYINDYFSVEVPTAGGNLTEGIVGTARFVNPLLAITDADRDLTALVYSGLLRATPEGELVPDLAESHEVSEDGLTHTFILRDDLRWQDGEKLSTEDVAFTIAKAQDPLLKSPRRPNWEGVRVEVVNEREIKFHLKQRYNSFDEAATMGIIPKHLWDSLDVDQFSFTELNLLPVGSGPYRVVKVKRDDDGIPRAMNLVPFQNFALGAAHIRDFRIVFYPNEAALAEGFRQGEIESLSAISSETAAALAKDGARLVTTPLPRIFAVFFNQNRASIFAQKDLREALSLAVDRNLIIDAVLKGYGNPIETPLPATAPKLAAATSSSQTASSTADQIARARAHLTAGGWVWHTDTKTWTKRVKNQDLSLTFSLATAETPELRQAAEIVKSNWEALGAQVELKVYEIGDLNRDVIRPREYEALLFGQVLGRKPDLGSFWHSSQRLDPGLNISMYTNISVDKLLEDLRQASSAERQAEIYDQAAETIRRDVPAAFLYSPDLIYVMPKKIKNVRLPLANTASDRFSNVHEWYSATDKVWRIFAKNN